MPIGPTGGSPRPPLLRFQMTIGHPTKIVCSNWDFPRSSPYRQTQRGDPDA